MRNGAYLYRYAPLAVLWTPTEPRLPFLIQLCSAETCTARYCAARQGYPHEFSTIRPRFPQSYPQERELSSTVVSKTAAKCGKLRNLALYRLVYVWISLWIMWKTLLTVSKNPANIPNFARLWQGFPQFPHSSPQNNPQKVNRLSTREGGIGNEKLGIIFLGWGGRCTFNYSLLIAHCSLLIAHCSLLTANC